MSVKIRLTRRGRKKLALYDIVVADSRSPRDGKFIEKIGSYNPGTHPATVVLDDTKAFEWVMDGAEPTDTVRHLLSGRGIMFKKHLQIGVNKGAVKQEVADKKFEDWKVAKEAALVKKSGDLVTKKADARKERLAAEAKVNDARKEALVSKKSAAAALLEETAKAAEQAKAAAKAEAQTPKEEVAASTEATEEKKEE
jgi:small subunit ribosomal protein S16